MNLIETLKQQSLLALKNKDKQQRSFYQLLQAEADSLAKTIKEPLSEKHINEAAGYLKRKLQTLNTEQSKKELEWLAPFCFQEMDEQQLQCLVQELKINKQMSIGQMMKHLSVQYGNSVDKGLAKRFYDSL